MAAHLVTLYDEIHRTILLNENINNDGNFRDVRLCQDFNGHYLLLVSNTGAKSTIRLKSIKIPPSTGVDYAKVIKEMADKYTAEVNSLL